MTTDSLHNLSLASATHLHTQGLISTSTRDQIHAKVHRLKRKAPVMPAFGSLVPQSAGHYMSTPTPVGLDESGVA